MVDTTTGDTPHAPPPDGTDLHEAALAYLARYAATEAGLLRVLQRRIDRWMAKAQAAGASRDAAAAQGAAATQAARQVVARLAAAGAVSDAAFAASKVRSLARAGKSRRVIAAHLAAKGVSADAQRRIMRDDANSEAGPELAAALVLARRRRIGPFRSGDPPDADASRRELGILARAGFPQAIARRALTLDPVEAAALINQLRR